MKRLFKYMAPLLVVMMLAGTAWADDKYDHITQAPNNKGDVLIFPWYLAGDGGWQTKFTVVNTSTEQYVVAKLVIRSFKYSEELLDFFLYLSPADVWTGVIRYDADKEAVVMYSEDDSALISTVPVTFASPEDPINQPMFPVKCTGDAEFLGYLEVITTAVGREWYKDIKEAMGSDACAGPPATRPVTYPAEPGMEKMTIFNEYDFFALAQAKDFSCDSNMKFPYRESFGTLAGWMDFQNPSLGLTSSLRSTTLKNYKNWELMEITQETVLGADADNSMTEIEASIAKNEIALPYLNTGTDFTLHFFTFPTKLTQTSDCKTFTSHSKFFGDNADKTGCILYKAMAFNLKEEYPKSGSPFSGGDSTNQKFCDEVNFVGSFEIPFEEGWVYYNLTKEDGKSLLLTEGWTQDELDDYESYDETGKLIAAPDMAFTGAPVLATYLNLGATGLSLEYGAWTDGKVGTLYSDHIYEDGDFDWSEHWIDYQYTEGNIRYEHN